MDEARSPSSAGTERPAAFGPARAAAVSLVFVAAADILFYERALGWTVGVYGACLLVAALAAGGRRIGLPGVVGTCAVALLLARCVEHPDALTVGVATLGLVGLALLRREGWTRLAPVWAARLGAFLTRAWLRPFVECGEVVGRRLGGTRAAAVTEALGWAVPLALAAVFVTIFSIANPVLAAWLGRTAQRILRVGDWLSPGRLLLWLMVAVWVWGLLRFRSGVRVRQGGSAAEPGGSTTAQWTPLITRCLLACNAVFAVQTLMDMSYLWGGAALPAGMSHAEYAQRGAYPLMAAALLAGLFVLAAFRGTRRDPGMRRARRLVYVWLGQSVFLVVSAAWRLWLYVGAYSLTRMRLAAAVWMLLVACGLVLVGVRIVRRRPGLWLVNANAAALLSVLYVCAFLNADGLVAGFNVRHCEEITGNGPVIDWAYLEQLGPETLPALAWVSERMEPGARADDVRAAAGRLRVRLEADLADPCGWTLRRARLARAARSVPPAEARPATDLLLAGPVEP